MKEVYKNIYMAELPLPNNPLKILNLYIVKGKDISMMIDTGFNREDTKEEIIRILKKLNLKFENTILYLTHLHSDHTGLATFLEKKGMCTYISKIDGKLLNQSVNKSDSMWQNTIQQSKWQGLEEDALDIKEHPGFRASLRATVRARTCSQAASTLS